MERRTILVLLGLVPSVLRAEEKGVLRAKGTFTSGISYGDVTLHETATGWVVELNENFRHDGSPDPWVAFGSDGFRRDGIIGQLQHNDGKQRYQVGPRLNPREMNEIYIWCVQHNTSLGRARLTWQE